MRFHRSGCQAGGEDDRASAPGSCMQTRAMTSSGVVTRFVDEESLRVLLGVASSQASG